MPEAKEFECPSCGSPLTTDGESAEIKCDYCGRTIIVPESLRVHHEPAPTPAAPQRMVIEIDAGPRGIEAEQREIEAMQRLEAARRSRRRGGGCGCLSPLAFIAVLAVAFLALGNPTKNLNTLQAALGDPAKSLDALQGAIGLPTARPTVVPVTRPLTAALPRQVQYANLLFTVTGGTITNQLPADATNHESALRSNQAHAYLDVKVANPSTNGIASDANMISLSLAGAQRYPEESGWADWVNADSTQTPRIYFTVPVSATWQGAQLVISQPGKEPAIMALDGPAAPARFPLSLSDRGKATVANVDYEIQLATLDLDANGKRAASGRRFLILAMRVFNHGTAGVAVSDANYRLVAGGDMLAPLKAPIDVVAASSVLQGEVVFDVPANAGRVELQVGEVGRGDTKRLAINLPGP